MAGDFTASPTTAPAAVHGIGIAGRRRSNGTTRTQRHLHRVSGAVPRAADAVAIFCYQARMFLGALVAVLGGLNTLVFTGGIGAGTTPVRDRIRADIEFLGNKLDPVRNRAHAPELSRDGSPVTVRVMCTDEESVILRRTARLIEHGGGTRVRV